jgi:hypothetical protein
MRQTSEKMAEQSLDIVIDNIERQRADIDQVLKHIESTHDEYELLHYRAYQALLAYDRHLELAKDEINKQIQQ